MRLPVRCINRKQLFVLITISIVILLVNNFIAFSESFWNPKHINYFSEELSFDENQGYIVNTSHCKILNLSAWDPSIQHFLRVGDPYTTTDCYQTHKHWTYVEGTNLVLNVTAIKESGYTVNSLYCCYRVITRVEQTLDKYDLRADAVSRVSDECVQLTREVTSLTVEFIRVRCSSKYWPLHSDIVYRNHHTLAQPFKSQKTIDKIKYWASSENENEDSITRTMSNTTANSTERPPNVLILGIDSVSRLNFQRNMKKTRQYLIDIGAIEMLGYTKVGENTLPNVQSILSGYSEQDLTKICYFSPETPQDDCPYIWKRFNEANYLTAHLEDAPGLNAFNRLKTGFVNVQVDYYLRPFMLDIFGPIFAKDCIGPDTQDQKVFNYIENLYNMSRDHNHVPLFIFTWLTNLAHSDLNAAESGDRFYHDFLAKMNLDNTILFFISDHGFRYGAFRETFMGWFEDKLPTMYVYLPPEIRKRRPEMLNALQINSRRLLSPFDLYHTLEGILMEFASPPLSPLPDSVDRHKNKVYRKFGQSIFKEVSPTRTCLSVGVSGDFCACGIPRKISLDSFELISAAKSSVEYINAKLPWHIILDHYKMNDYLCQWDGCGTELSNSSNWRNHICTEIQWWPYICEQCTKLRLTKVTAGGLLDMMGTGSAKKTGDFTIIVAFVTSPGNFIFESTVDYNNTHSQSHQFQVTGNVLRMNKINNDVSCVKDAALELLCFCE